MTFLSLLNSIIETYFQSSIKALDLNAKFSTKTDKVQHPKCYTGHTFT